MLRVGENIIPQERVPKLSDKFLVPKSYYVDENILLLFEREKEAERQRERVKIGKKGTEAWKLRRVQGEDWRKQTESENNILTSSNTKI